MNPDEFVPIGVHTGIGGTIVGELWNMRIRLDGELGWATVCIRQGEDREKMLLAKKAAFCAKCREQCQECSRG